MRYNWRMLYVNFKRRRGRVAVIHQEKCPRIRDWMYPGSKKPTRGYWLHVLNEETAEVVASDLKATLSYPKCCERIRLSGAETPRAEQGEYNLEDFEIVDGPDTLGLHLWDESRADHTWWMPDQDFARLHGRIHETLNLDNEALDASGGISPPGKYR